MLLLNLADRAEAAGGYDTVTVQETQRHHRGKGGPDHTPGPPIPKSTGLQPQGQHPTKAPGDTRPVQIGAWAVWEERGADKRDPSSKDIRGGR